MPAYNERGYVVRLAESALIQMCLSGLEAYSVAHHGTASRTSLETYGLLWGHEVRLSKGQTLYAVEMAAVDTSAVMRPREVQPSDEALTIKREVMTSFWPHLQLLGDFHSHPYPRRSPGEIVAQKQYWCSVADRKDVERRPDFWREQGYRVALVLSIAHLHRASSRRDRWLEESAMEFTFGNYRLWLKAHIAYDDDRGRLRVTEGSEDKIYLECPGIMGLGYEYAPFGRAGTTGQPRYRPRESDDGR